MEFPMDIHATGCKENGQIVVCQYNNNNNLSQTKAIGGLQTLYMPSYNISRNLNESSFHKTPASTGHDMDVIWHLLTLYYTPTVTTVGVGGNILMSAVLIGSHLQKNSANHYLAGAMLADAIYLIGLLLLWLKYVDMDLYNRKGWCQIISFINRVSSFLSLWLIVAFSVDRLIVHVAPRRAAQLCTPFRAKLVVLAMVIVAVVVFVNISLTVGVVTNYGTPRCVPLLRFVQQLRHLELVDSLVNVVVPYSLMVGILVTLARYAVALRHELDDPHAHGVVETNQQESLFQIRPYRLTAFSCVLLFLFLSMRIPSDTLRLLHTLRNAVNNFTPTAWSGVLFQQYASPIFQATFAMKPYLMLTFHGDVKKCLAPVARKLRLCCCRNKTTAKEEATSLEVEEFKNNNAEPQEV